MATPHSLPSNSPRAQLPFGPASSVTSPTAHRLQGKNRSHSNSVSSQVPHTRSGSIVSSRSRTHTNLLSGELFSPPPPLPLFHPRTVNTSTHTPGSQPSSSLFHAQRPHVSTSPTPHGRPSSPGSIVSSEAHAMLPVRLAPFTRHDTRDTEYSVSINLSSTEDLNHAVASASKSNKHSREPLLPIGVSRPRRSTVNSRPSGSLMGPYGRSESNVSTGGRMRDSFEKLFKRGLSHDSGKKTSSSPVVNGPPSSNGADSPTNCMPRSRQASPITPTNNAATMTFDLSAMENHAPSPPNRPYKNSPSPRGSSASLRHTTFNPVPPPDMHPPLAQTPQVDKKTGKPLRNWQLHPSRNRFFLNGRILTGGDTPWAFIASLTVSLGITGVWFGTTCVWWWLNESPAVAGVGAYLCLLTLSSMWATVSSLSFQGTFTCVKSEGL